MQLCVVSHIIIQDKRRCNGGKWHQVTFDYVDLKDVTVVMEVESNDAGYMLRSIIVIPCQRSIM